VRVIDLNQDGNLDIITLNKGTRSSAAPGTLSVLFGNGDGTFKTQAQYGISGKYFAMMAFGDFNNDGRTDIVISNEDAGYMSILLQTERNEFYDGGRLENYAVYSLAAGDINGDGKDDIIFGNRHNEYSNIIVYLNTGGDNPQRNDFQAISFSSYIEFNNENLEGDFVYNPYFVRVADIDRNGAVDIVWTNNAGTTDFYYVTVAYQGVTEGGDPTGEFGAHSYGSLSNYFALEIADFNNDGWLDIAASQYGGSGISLQKGVTVLINSGLGDRLFNPAHNYTLNTTVYYLHAVDIDSDGFLDLVTSTTDMDHSISVSINNGVGIFSIEQTYYKHIDCMLNSVASGDFNKDGRPDLVFASVSTTYAYLLMNDIFVEHAAKSYVDNSTPLYVLSNSLMEAIVSNPLDAEVIKAQIVTILTDDTFFNLLPGEQWMVIHEAACQAKGYEIDLSGSGIEQLYINTFNSMTC